LLSLFIAYLVRSEIKALNPKAIGLRNALYQVYDLAIIGGGINGCGIARDAAGRGYSVFLCEMNDLASGTSSWSTKLIHGGLRYLEYYEFRLVREALIEREVLWRMAPHIIKPLRFVLPHHRKLRPAWLLRLGLFLYDHLGGRKLLPPTRTLDLERDAAGEPLAKGRFTHGFEYSDCFVDDARLVLLNALDAAARDAVVRTRTRAVEIKRAGDAWQVTVEDTTTGKRDTIRARAIVNAAGPWVEDILTRTTGVDARAAVRLVQGSHIVVRKLYAHARAYMFQNEDGRIVFVIPYENDFTLIGTTDRDYEGDPAKVEITKEETDYLCEAVSGYLAQAVTPADVVWTYAGVRPLYDDGASEAKAATRDYVFELDASDNLPLLSIFGGKITTYRRLAEEALERLAPYLPEPLRERAGWTAAAALPGGDFDVRGLPDLASELRKTAPFLERDHAQRLARSYGTRARDILKGATSFADLGRHFGASLTEAEVRFAIATEWALTAEDMLWRRSKLGLRLTPQQAEELAAWMTAQRETSVPQRVAGERL
jgi:glycerol-3-phosphate dehydrogenase